MKRITFTNGITLESVFFICVDKLDGSQTVTFNGGFKTGFHHFYREILKFQAVSDYTPPSQVDIEESIETITTRDYEEWVREVQLLVSDMS